MFKKTFGENKYGLLYILPVKLEWYSEQVHFTYNMTHEHKC